MIGKPQIDVYIRPWSDGDLPLLERLLGDPAMTEHLGGSETPEKILERHKSYCNCLDPNDVQFVIVAGPDKAAAGWIGYWERDWQGQSVLETGWLVLPEFQGKGIATKAAALMVEQARGNATKQFIHAFPSIDNSPSNIVCRKAGFCLQGEVCFEYPVGHYMRCNDWCLDLCGNREVVSPQ